MIKINKIINIIFISIILIMFNNLTSYSKIVEQLGDVNLDGKINGADLLKIQRYIANSKLDKKEEWNLTEEEFRQADIDENGKVNITDLLYMQRYIAASRSDIVKEKNPEWIELTEKRIFLDPEGIELEEEIVLKINGEEEKKLNPRIYPETEDINTKVEWKSDNELVAKVSEEGIVSAYDLGETTITATTVNGKEAKCKVVVRMAPAWIELSQENVVIDKSKSINAELEAYITPFNATEDRDIIWISENEEIVRVDEKGFLTGISEGTAKVKASTTNGKEAICEVTVIEKRKEIEFENREIILTLGEKETDTIRYSISDENANINWDSSNKEVATVDDQGNVAAKAKGETIITASIENGNTASCRVKVLENQEEKIVPEEIKLNKEELDLDVNGNKEEKIESTILPNNCNYYTTIKWISEDPTVATVNAEGKIIAKSSGTTKIIASTDNGITAECEVRVQTSPEKIELSKSNETLKMGVQETTKLSATILPETADANTEITWSSNNEEVAMVDQDGNVFAKKEGEVTITVKSGPENSKEDSCLIRILKEDEEIIRPESVIINTSVVLDINGEKQKSLTAKILPENVNADSNITWSSSNNNVANVDSKGNITANKKGTSIITVKTGNGKTATCTVTVHESPTKITLNKSEMELDLGATKEYTLKPTIVSSTADINRDLTWTSSKPEVVKVNSYGKIQALKRGEADITVTTKNGKSAKCTVTVFSSPTSITLSSSAVTIDMATATTKTLKLTISPSYIDRNKSVTWVNSDATVASVSSKFIDSNHMSVTITAKKVGTCKLTGKTPNGKTATCTVTVKKTSISPTSISFTNTPNEFGYVQLKKGGSIKAKITPSNANTNNKVTYTISGNSKVVSCKPDGTITAKQAGIVTVTAKTGNGKTATIKLHSKVGNSRFVTNDPDNKVLEANSFSSSALSLFRGKRSIDGIDNKGNRVRTHLQSFDVINNNEVYYAGCAFGLSKSENIIDYGEGNEYQGKYSFIRKETRTEKNTTLDKGMILKYFGHQGSIDIEKAKDGKTYVWASAVSSEVNSSEAYTYNLALSRVEYKNGAKYTFEPRTWNNRS